MADSERIVRKFEVLRFDPDQDQEPRYDTYEVPCMPDWVVLDALNAIKDDIDPTLAHRWSCRMGVCGSCSMLVNGRPILTCNAFVSGYEGTIRVEPLSNFPIVRDLVVELDSFIDKIQSVKPWIVRKVEKDLSDGEYLQSPGQLEEYKQFSMCINCALCYAACPVLANEPEFVGPAAIALAHRYNLDSRDEGADERNEIFRGEGTVFSCSYANECSEVCPKNVDPSRAIQQAKMLSVFDWAKSLVMPRKGAQ